MSVLKTITSALRVDAIASALQPGLTGKKTAPYGFHGGLCLDTNKRALRNSASPSIVKLEPPTLLVVPLIDYDKQTLAPVVRVHEHVKRGQALATGVVSPVSGVVEAIEQRDLIHPGGLQTLCVVIRNDGFDTPAKSLPGIEYKPSVQLQPQQSSSTQPRSNMIDHTNDHADVDAKINLFVAQPESVLDYAALTGLGGAGFPTARKLDAVNHSIHTLIINAAECEPEIACDEALMQSSAQQIAYGINALIQLTKCEECIIAIEESKEQAIESMRAAIANIDSCARLMIIPTRYPAGAQSPLIQNVTGRYIPHNEKPATYGVLCINVATAHALWIAINGQALDSRIVSLGGSGMPNPCNVRVRFGTPIAYVLDNTGNSQATNSMRIRAGGPLSGFDQQCTNAPITATTNCILAEPVITEMPAQACIRCGDCADVCPAYLQPQQLHWFTQAEQYHKCDELNLDACIECGCCDLVCPASIKLTETFRFAKATINVIQTQQQSAIEAEQKFEEHENRLARRAQERQRAIEERKEKLKSQQQPDNDKISAALTRARAKRGANKNQ